MPYVIRKSGKSENAGKTHDSAKPSTRQRVKLPPPVPAPKPPASIIQYPQPVNS
ncbi:MAG TPA: hypothetical protein VHX63_07390 [Acidobacteriaceae bacterium]|nr:hypothetical protein [Acidobacteriaceae bacterium]